VRLTLPKVFKTIALNTRFLFGLVEKYWTVIKPYFVQLPASVPFLFDYKSYTITPNVSDDLHSQVHVHHPGVCTLQNQALVGDSRKYHYLSLLIEVATITL